MRLVCAALAALFGAGCNDCDPSADLQVTVQASSDADAARIKTLHVSLSVDGGGPKTLDVPLAHALAGGGSAFILRPDPPPASKYQVTVTVQALAADGALVEAGTSSGNVVDKGCNRLLVRLVATTPAGDMGGGDLGGGDMSACQGATPDEDSDGRANACDVCPADYDPTPVDSDNDGLPDACDPDPATGTNRNLYFDPFDAPSGHWSSGPVSGSALFLDSAAPNGVVISSNTVDKLPLNARAQTWMQNSNFYTGFTQASAGMFLGTDPNPSSSQANGAWCLVTKMQAQTNGGQLEIRTVQGGTETQRTSTPFPFVSIFNGVPAKYRIRVTQVGGNVICEAASDQSGLGPASVSLPVGVGAGGLYMTLRAESVQQQFYSVVAETKLP